MPGNRHTPEEVTWIKKKFKLIGKSFNPNKIDELGLPAEYKKKFGKDILATGLVTWIRTIQHPEIYGYAAVLKRKELREKGLIPPKRTTSYATKIPNKLLKTLEQARYILYVFNSNILGFDTKEQVKEYLEQAAPQEPIKLFENVKAEVKHSVDVLL